MDGAVFEWTWDARKSASNRRKHGIGFDVAQYVFEDSRHQSRPDPDPDEERWQTVGTINGVCLLVVHTWPEAVAGSEREIGRIISARKATRGERDAYEEGSF